jgi:hypothetical protein
LNLSPTGFSATGLRVGLVILRRSLRTKSTILRVSTSIGAIQNAQDECLTPHWSRARPKNGFRRFADARPTRHGTDRATFGPPAPLQTLLPVPVQPHTTAFQAWARFQPALVCWARHARLAPTPQAQRPPPCAVYCGSRAASPPADPRAAHAPRARADTLPKRA